MIIDNLLLTKQQLAFICLKKEAFNKQKVAIMENRVKKEIWDAGIELKAEIDKSVSQREKKANTGTEEKLSFMSAQAEDAQITEVILQSCVDYVKRELNINFQQQILVGRTQMVEFVGP